MIIKYAGLSDYAATLLANSGAPGLVAVISNCKQTLGTRQAYFKASILTGEQKSADIFIYGAPEGLTLIVNKAFEGIEGLVEGIVQSQIASGFEPLDFPSSKRGILGLDDGEYVFTTITPQSLLPLKDLLPGQILEVGLYKRLSKEESQRGFPAAIYTTTLSNSSTKKYAHIQLEAGSNPIALIKCLRFRAWVLAEELGQRKDGFELSVGLRVLGREWHKNPRSRRNKSIPELIGLAWDWGKYYLNQGLNRLKGKKDSMPLL